MSFLISFMNVCVLCQFEPVNGQFIGSKATFITLFSDLSFTRPGNLYKIVDLIVCIFRDSDAI
jgi:hypothetical protein